MPDITEGLEVDGQPIVDAGDVNSDAGFERALRNAAATTEQPTPAADDPGADSAADIKRALGGSTESTDVSAGLTGGLNEPSSAPAVEPKWVRDEGGNL